MSTLTISKRVCRCASAALLIAALLAAPFAIHAQTDISKEEYAKRQKSLQRAIAAMEAEEVRQLAADRARQAAQLSKREEEIRRDSILTEAPDLAADGALVSKAKTDIAAREARMRADAPAVVVAMLDAPQGGVPAGGSGPAPGAEPQSVADREASRKKKDKDQEVEILAEGGCTFNSKANLVVYEIGVIVNHPQFDLACDKLIVFLKKNAAAGQSALSKAIATGKRVTIQQMTIDGELQIGQSRKITFEGDTGNVILQGWPQVQTGNTLVSAKEESTVMILNQDGKMKVNGPSKTTLVLPEKEPVKKPGE